MNSPITQEKKIIIKENLPKEKKVKNKIVIIGSGAFGTALASIFSRRNSDVVIYGIDSKEVKDINENHKNSKYFSKDIPASVYATDNLRQALDGAEIMVLAIPSHAFKGFLTNSVLPILKRPIYFVNASKGLDTLNFELLTTTIKKIIPKDLRKGVLKLSGPSFAIELMNNVPTKFVLASSNIEEAKKVAKYLESSYIQVAPSDNLEGVELVSILKNPLSIFLGIVNGLKLGYNAKAWVFTDAVNEIGIILEHFNIDRKIIFSPAGIGDMYLTGSSRKSRNFSVGYQIGKANKMNKKVLSYFTTIEGFRSIELIVSFAVKNNIKLDLFTTLYEITYNRKEPMETLLNYFKVV